MTAAPTRTATPTTPAVALVFPFDADGIDALRQLLRGAGLQAVTAPLLTAPAPLPPARMAIVNGAVGSPAELQTLAAVRASLPATVPVLFLGATPAAAVVAAVSAHGASDYMTRPLDRETFRRKAVALTANGADGPREREDFRRRIAAAAATPVKVRGCAAKRLALETPFPVAPGGRLTFTSPGLSKLAGLAPGQRYVCRVTACHPQDKVFLLTGDLLGTPLELPNNRF